MTPITRPAEFQVTEQRSRFLAEVRPAASLDEIKGVVAARRKNLRKANHHVWACRFHDDQGRLVEQARDDGEVGRPGMALLELLRHEDLEGMLIVSRIFGGVKLGPGGVKRAFRAAGQGALEQLGARSAGPRLKPRLG
ncbi:MAG: YigZ family protein [Gemmatimonadales bacterium]